MEKHEKWKTKSTNQTCFYIILKQISYASNNDDAAGNDTVIDNVIDKGGVVDDDVQEYHETTFVDSQSEEDDEDDNDIEFLPSEGMFDEPFWADGQNCTSVGLRMTSLR